MHSQHSDCWLAQVASACLLRARTQSSATSAQPALQETASTACPQRMPCSAALGWLPRFSRDNVGVGRRAGSTHPDSQHNPLPCRCTVPHRRQRWALSSSASGITCTKEPEQSVTTAYVQGQVLTGSSTSNIICRKQPARPVRKVQGSCRTMHPNTMRKPCSCKLQGSCRTMHPCTMRSDR
jgi:hypothetical protein